MDSGIQAKKPVKVLKKTVKIDFKELGKSAAKGSAHIVKGEWGNLLDDGAELASALGLENSVGETAWTLVSRALLSAMTSLVSENLGFSNDSTQRRELDLLINIALESQSLIINSKFFNCPEQSPLFRDVIPRFGAWLEQQGLTDVASKMISLRLPTYFVAAVHNEWGERFSNYEILRSHLDTPFTQANDRLHSWMTYSAWLVRQIDEPMFNESFSLRQVFVPPRAYFMARNTSGTSVSAGQQFVSEKKRVVVDLKSALFEWLNSGDPEDAIKLISGGPGSGKSSFAKIFAAEVAKNFSIDVLFIPLHHFEPTNDLVDAVGKFVQVDGFSLNNPLVDLNHGRRLLIIFDGLDELAMQGKVAAKAAQDFVREVLRKVDRLNRQSLWLKVLISGREVVIQQSESDFRRDGQVLHLLPYYVEKHAKREYDDKESLLDADQRQTWWVNYGKAIGANYKGLPKELIQENLNEITAQPLLNYLVALSLRRGKLKFSKDTNLNTVYSDLLKAIYERGWSTHQHAAIQGIDENDFCRILEEIALATWHGDGRKTTVRDISEHCESSGLKNLLSQFQTGLEEDSRSKVTQLLTAFYFRQNGQDVVGEKTFEFTHKSFGEYLTAKRIVREIGLITKQIIARRKDPDLGWDEKECLRRWVLLCGVSTIDEYLFQFVLDELQLEHSRQSDLIFDFQRTLSHLFALVLKSGTPMERLVPRLDFKEESRRARNSEEALMICLNACARITREVSKMEWPSPQSMSEWLFKIVGQPPEWPHVFLLQCLSYLDLEGCDLRGQFLYSADLSKTNLKGARLVSADLRYTVLDGTVFDEALFGLASFYGSDYSNASFNEVSFEGARLMTIEAPPGNEGEIKGPEFSKVVAEGADFSRNDLRVGNFRNARLSLAKFRYANLIDADFSEADLRGADFTGANLGGAKFTDALLEDAVFDEAIT